MKHPTNFMDKRINKLNGMSSNNVTKFLINNNDDSTQQPTIEINQNHINNTQIRKNSYAAQSG